MIKVLILCALAMSSFKADCLTKENLIKLGLTPLETPS